MKTKLPFYGVALLLAASLACSCDNTDYQVPALTEGQELLSETRHEAVISSDDAISIANTFLQKFKNHGSVTRSSIEHTNDTYTLKVIDDGGNPLMYVINYTHGGFVIVGSSKNYYPILAYSDKGSFDVSGNIGGTACWLQETEYAINNSTLLNDTIKEKITAMWNYFDLPETAIKTAMRTITRSTSASDAEIACWNRCEELQNQYGGDGWMFMPLVQAQQVLDEAGFGSTYTDLCYGADFNKSDINASVFAYKKPRIAKEVGPLLTTAWHQSAPYNDFCDGNPAGCGPIAAAQVMFYYKHPQGVFQWQNYYFTWNDMSATPKSNSATAAFIRWVGHFLGTSYHSSYAYTTPGNFKDGLQLMGYAVESSDFNPYRVGQELFNNRPVIMLGNDDNIPLPGSLKYIGSSHYWICDGAKELTIGQMWYYTEWQPYGKGEFVKGWNTIDAPGLLGGTTYSHYHMNWGMGGGNDGWFVFDSTNSGHGNFEHARKDFYIQKAR